MLSLPFRTSLYKCTFPLFKVETVYIPDNIQYTCKYQEQVIPTIKRVKNRINYAIFIIAVLQ
jgi:hypothetical protein